MSLMQLLHEERQRTIPNVNRARKKNQIQSFAGENNELISHLLDATCEKIAEEIKQSKIDQNNRIGKFQAY